MTKNYIVRIWGEDDERDVAVNSGAANEFVLPMSDAVEVIKDWNGDFYVDIAVELQLTRNEKVQILGEIKRDMVADMNLLVFSDEEVKPFKDARKAINKLLGFDKIFQDAEIEAFYDSLVKRGQALQVQQQSAAEAQAAAETGATQNTPPTQRSAAERGSEAPQPNENII